MLLRVACRTLKISSPWEFNRAQADPPPKSLDSQPTDSVLSVVCWPAGPPLVKLPVANPLSPRDLVEGLCKVLNRLRRSNARSGPEALKKHSSHSGPDAYRRDHLRRQGSQHEVPANPPAAPAARR